MSQSFLHKLSAKDALDDSSPLHTLIDSLPEQVYVKDTEGRYVLTNLAHLRALGFESPEEVAGKTDSDFFPKELAERYRADEQEILRSDRPLVEHEEPSVDKEGNRRWQSTTKVPLRDGSEQIVGLVGIARDVTERKKAEEKLKESEDRFRSLTDAAFEGIAIIEDGKILETNRAFAEMFGYEVSEVSGMSALELKASEVRDEVGRKMSSGFSEPYESVGLKKDGSTFDIEIRGRTAWYEDRSVRVTAIRDITERKRAEEVLKESEERYRQLVELSPEMVAVHSDGKWLYINDAGARLVGASDPEELIGKPVMDFVHPDYREIVRSRHSQLERGESNPFLEQKLIRLDGQVVDVEVASSPLTYQGNPANQSLVRDITERKETEEKLRESEERFRSAFENAPIGVALVDLDGRRFRVNRALCEMLGYLEEELCSEEYLEHIHPDDREISLRHRRETLEKGEGSYILERRYIHADGHTVWNLTSVSLIHDAQGNPSHLVCLHQDITDRKLAEEALKESEERFRSAFEDAPIGVALVGLDRSHLRVNRAFCDMLGYSEKEMLEKAHPDIIHPEDHELSAERLRQALEGGPESYTLERRYIHADGRVIWNLTSVSLIRDSRGEPSHLVCLHQDITERKELEERLEHQAFHDSLTELPNRLLFLDRLNHALARTTRESGPVAVLIADLDDFKFVNDSLGHDAGNTVLAQVAERLRSSVRPGDTVGRIFGDEFAVLLEAPAGVNEARRVAERIQESLQAPFNVDGHEVYVRASIGISLAETAEDEPKEILRHADLAMYEAKRHGVAQYEVYNPSMVVHALERMNLERDLRRAVEREEFEVHYQPKVLLKTGEIVGVEALVRWKHPDRGLLAAEQFIQLAEETGLINRIGLWVLKESCRQLKEWQERYPEKLGLQVDLCVNLSAKELRQPELTEKVAAVLHQTGLTPSCLTVEISERTAMEDAEQTIAQLRELKELGVELALDDFGTGYCSLVYLEHSLLDFLKIDRLLIHRKKENWEECVAIVSAMTSMAHTLGLAVIVEGVEDEDQVAELKGLGCEMAQGHYFAEALPSEAVERLLVEGNS